MAPVQAVALSPWMTPTPNPARASEQDSWLLSSTGVLSEMQIWERPAPVNTRRSSPPLQASPWPGGFRARALRALAAGSGVGEKLVGSLVSLQSWPHPSFWPASLCEGF